MWDDPAVDWAAADLVLVRSTWDYEFRLPEFLAWADAVGPGLVNSAAALRWNTDKAYLVEPRRHRPADRPDGLGGGSRRAAGRHP